MVLVQLSAFTPAPASKPPFTMAAPCANDAETRAASRRSLAGKAGMPLHDRILKSVQVWATRRTTLFAIGEAWRVFERLGGSVELFVAVEAIPFYAAFTALTGGPFGVFFEGIGDGVLRSGRGALGELGFTRRTVALDAKRLFGHEDIGSARAFVRAGQAILFIRV